MEHIVHTLVDYIWSDALVYLAFAVGLYFTIVTKGVQFRYFFEMIRLLKEKHHSPNGISSFQAFCMSLSGRIGVGNIAGVATAIAAGGPGAIFWMNVMALLGSASAFIESTLAQIYKDKIGNEYRGGSPYYIERGLNLKSFAILVAIVICLSYGILVPGIQANTIATSFNNAFKIPTWITGIVIVSILSFLILGGIKRIARAADFIMPFMALGYILFLIVIVFAHISQLPEVIRLIISSALGQDAVFGGIVGTAISWGARRAVFSNVAGAGEATFSSAAAEVSHPVKQGLVQSFSVYIDTVVVCTATGLMILLTGMYNVAPPHMDTPLVEHIPGIVAGTAFTQAALETVFGSLGPMFVAIAIFFFAFTCLMAYYYIAETAMVYLVPKNQNTIPFYLLRTLFLIIVYLGSIQSANLMWGLGDIGFGSMCYLNFIAIVLLTKPALKSLQDYDQQKAQGLNPIFDAQKTGIQHANFWITSTQSNHKS